MSKISKKYIAVIEKEKNSDYGVFFPDFPGCVTAASTLEEAKDLATEVLQFHVDGLVADGEELPEASTLDKIKAKNKKAEVFIVISAKTPTKAVRINVTIDEALLRRLDKYLGSHGENRSGFFAKVAREKLIQA